MEIAHAQVVFVVGSAELVADIFLPPLDTAHEPAHTSGKSLDEIPQVQGIPQSTQTQEAASVGQRRLLQANGAL